MRLIKAVLNRVETVLFYIDILGKDKKSGDSTCLDWNGCKKR